MFGVSDVVARLDGGTLGDDVRLTGGILFRDEDGGGGDSWSDEIKWGFLLAICVSGLV